MALAVDRQLDQLDAEDEPEGRNGHYRRRWLTTVGDNRSATRRFTPPNDCMPVRVDRRKSIA
jgi:hypothetical protein